MASSEVNEVTILQQLTNFWGNLDRRAKIVIGGVSIFALIGLILLTFFGRKTDYAVLFSGLAMGDAAAISERLDDLMIPYSIQEIDGRTAILVPQDQVHTVRLRMAGEGLPTGGYVGFEIFDQLRLGTTEFERQINFYRALSGELSRSIMHMDDIIMARVSITAPRRSLYLDYDILPEASVLLQLNPRAELTHSQIKAIAHLVASSVEGLTPEKVSIVDTRGNLLSLREINELMEGVSLTASQLDIQQQFQRALQYDLHRMLTRVLGPDRVVVQVQAILNFDERARRSETFEPFQDGEGIKRSEQMLEESFSGTMLPWIGVPGTFTNIPGYEQIEGTGEGQYDRQEAIINYEISNVVEEHRFATGGIERLSVAVIVDGELTIMQQNAIQEAVVAATGIDLTRGDTISVTGIEFDRSLEAELLAERLALEEAERQRERNYLLLILGLGFLLFLTLFFFWRRKQKEEELVLEEELLDEAAPAAEEKEIEEDEMTIIRREITELVKNKPEEVAEILKAWLIDE